MTAVAIAGVLLGFVASLPPPGQDAPAFGLAMIRLALELDLDYIDGSVAGTARYTVHNASEQSVTTVPFNLGRLMTVESVRRVDAVDLPFTQAVVVFEDDPRRQVNHVVVTLPEPLAPGAEVILALRYRGILVGYTETGSLYIRDRVDSAFSILREDAFAWPVLGSRSLRANRTAPRPDFPFDARITVPEGITVASGGTLVSRTARAGRATFHYRSAAPVPFLNLPIAPYRELRQEGIRVYYFPADSAGAARVLDRATGGLALLARWFGPLGATPDLAVMEIPEGWGSQASLTAGIIQTADAFREPGRMVALYHELTHLWNAPDLDQPSARWNEGLATWLSRRMGGVLDGSEGLEEDVGRTAERLRSAAPGSPLERVPFAEYGEARATDLSYRVGFLMFYALDRALGTERLDAALGRYYQDHWRTGGTFEQLISTLRDAAGGGLEGFFETWVTTTRWYEQLRAGVPPGEIGWTSQ